ncbi:MAG TPA: hypothetical protein VMH22_04530 [bacterium]|nr:hypothetical protein [bacterium]
MRTLAALFVLVGALAAQPVVEKAVPFDSSGHVYSIDRQLRSRLGLFPDAGDIVLARMWLSPAGHVLEFTRPDSSRERIVLTDAEFGQLLSDVREKLPTEFGLDQSGRGLFLLSQIPLAGAWYTVATVYLLNLQDGRAIGTVATLTAATAYFLPMIITSHTSVTQAQAAMSIDYGYYGVFNGYALASLLGLRNLFESSAYADQRTMQAASGLMLVTSIGGQILGSHLGQRLELGQERFASVMTDCGLLDGLDLGICVQSISDNSAEGGHLLNSALTIAGTVGGAYLGHTWGRQQHWTEGQATCFGTAGIFGPAVLNGAFWTVAPSSWGEQHVLPLLTGLALAGNVGGIYLADRLVGETPITNSAGLMALGTTIGGGLLGAGLGWAIWGNLSHEQDFRGLLGLTTVGFGAGYWYGIKFAKQMSSNESSHADNRLKIDFGQALCGALSYGSNRTFAAPRLVSVAF